MSDSEWEMEKWWENEMIMKIKSEGDDERVSMKKMMVMKIFRSDGDEVGDDEMVRKWEENDDDNDGGERE